MSGFFAAMPWWLGTVLALACAGAGIAYFRRVERARFLGRGVAIWLLCAATLGGLMAMQARAAERKEEQKRLLAAQQAAEEAKVRAQEAQATRAAAGDILTEGRAALEHARTVLAAGKYDEVETVLSSTTAQLEKLAALVPPVDGALGLRDEVNAVNAEAGSFVSAKQACAAAIEHAQTYWPDVVAYDAQLEADAAALRAISGAPLKRYERDMRRAQAAVQARRKGIAKKVERAKAEARRVASTRAACGDKPLLSPWDGELVGAERYLKEGAHDPDSIDVEFCTDPVLTHDFCWVSTCSVRGKNAFGALVLNRMRFSVGRDGILGAVKQR